MPKLMLLALFIIGCTLVVPLFVWGQSGSWRTAIRAWWEYARWMLALYVLGFLVWWFSITLAP